MVHQGSTTVLLCLAIFLSTLPVTSGDWTGVDVINVPLHAVDVFESKDEALAHCKSIKDGGHFTVYAETQGDVFYDCDHEKEMQSKLKTGAPCNPDGSTAESPVGSVTYTCENGHWQIKTCLYGAFSSKCWVATYHYK